MLYEPVARYYTDLEINTWIDDACKDISLKTFCNTAKGSAITTVAGQAEYAYPDTVNATAVVTLGIKTLVDSSNVSLEFITPDLFGRVTDASMVKWGEWNREIVLSPTPSTSGLTYTPYIWIERGQSAAGNIEAVPAMYHHLIPLYCVYKGHEKRGRVDVAQAVWQQYEQEMQRVLQMVTDKYNMVETKQRIQDASPAD
jgi:hypothetical protein